MTVLDGHIHIMSAGAPEPAFAAALTAAGVDGGIVLSFPPPSFLSSSVLDTPAARRENLFSWTALHPRLLPFFWIDPLEPDALEQVTEAAAGGVAGFKIICNRFFPWDDRCMSVCRSIAAAGKPILFHSGILWDGTASSRYNRPAEFECLLSVPRLRFAMAHVSWPWCDEMIAVYGKFEAARRPWGAPPTEPHPEPLAELFIDLTPGTPVAYRRDVLTRLFTVGYDVWGNVFFGTDGLTDSYDAAKAREWIERDSAIYRELSLDDETVSALFGSNLERFLGVGCPRVHIS
jgi:predicted TIM-barrel fold metal-dependent hydrolase